MSRAFSKKNSDTFGLTVFVIFIIFTLCFLFFMYFGKKLLNESEVSSNKIYKIDDYCEALHLVRFYGFNGEVIHEELVQTGKNIENIPILEDNSYLFYGWDYPNYANYELKYYPVMENMDIYPIYNEQELLSLNGIALYGSEPSDIDFELVRSMVLMLDDTYR